MTTDRVYRALLALNAAEWRREMRRLRKPMKTPIEELTTGQATSATPRADATAAPVRRNHHAGET